MAFVSAEQIRQRLAYYEARRKQLEWKSENTVGRLRRYEVWEHHYFSDPYLTGAPDERLWERFRDIFVNVTELNSNGKISPLPIEQDSSFIQKFTHIQQEFGGRGGVPVDVIENARKPILRYFENGDPIALRMFDGYAAPQSPFVVKYGKLEFLEEMLKYGRMRISPASFYNQDSFSDAVKDDEVTRNFFIPTYRDRLKGEFHFDFEGHRMEYGDDDIVMPMVMPDYFLISLCDHIYYRMPTDFDANAALIIKNPELFGRHVMSQFLARWPGWLPMFRPVTYYDPYRDYGKVRVPELSKHFGYSYQREVRLAFTARDYNQPQLEPEFLTIGPMTEYAELVAA